MDYCAAALVSQTDIPRPEHPKPQFKRQQWLNLNGPWAFAIDATNTGSERDWLNNLAVFDRQITVPYPPESKLSGIEHKDFMDAVWYRRDVDVPADKYGRRATLIGIAALFFISALGAALATDVVMLSIARFIGGIGVGASSVVAPLYITEVAPAKQRGKLVASFQFNLVLGIMLAYLSNYIFDAVSYGTKWRMMLGIKVLPAAIFLIALFRVPRSPRWLITKANRPEEARGILAQVLPSGANAEVARIAATNTTTKAIPVKEFFSQRYGRIVGYAFIFAMFNQLSGINAVMYYAPDIFDSAGLGRSSALLSSVGVGAVNVLFTLIGMNLIDRVDRRKLMYVGSVGYIVSLAAMAFAFLSGATGGLFVPIALFVFIAAHAIGQGSVIWVFLSEIFGNEVRGIGTSWGCGTHWVFAAIIGAFLPQLASIFGEGLIFGFFSLCMVGQLLWVHFVMPETKGVNLEKLQQQLENRPEHIGVVGSEI